MSKRVKVAQPELRLAIDPVSEAAALAGAVAGMTEQLREVELRHRTLYRARARLAVALVDLVGPAAAARQLGCSRSTVDRWRAEA